MQKLYGTVVPIITPLTEDDRIDVYSVQNLVDHCIDGGLDCIYPCGTTGEMMYLTVQERETVAETVIEHVKGRVPVFIHTGGWNLADTIRLSRHAVEHGADGIASSRRRSTSSATEASLSFM
jgi:4-hydroxy-tetrahydrodipicolinate synthase